MTHLNTNPRSASTLHKHTAISPGQWQPWTAVSALLAKTAVYSCHIPGDMALPMRKVLARPHARPQSPRSFWSAPRFATSGQVQHRIHGLPVTLRKSDWFWSQSIVFTKPLKTGMSLDQARSRDCWCWPKGARPLGTRMARPWVGVLVCHLLLLLFIV